MGFVDVGFVRHFDPPWMPSELGAVHISQPMGLPTPGNR